MTGLVGETVTVGCFVLAGEVVWLGYGLVREAIRDHWFKVRVSFETNTPDGRYLRPLPEQAETPVQPKPASWEKRQRDPKTGQFLPDPEPLHEAGTEAA